MKTRRAMPVLVVGAEQSFGNYKAIVMRNAADKITQGVVPGDGHWLTEEAPSQTIRGMRDFIAP
jgi:pimeloyl-ACP methyl ester carboxylesterase